MFLKNGPTPASFLFIFYLFKWNITVLTTNQCGKMSCPSSIRHRDSNPWPSEHESPPVTTRPGLPPNPFFVNFRYFQTIFYVINFGLQKDSNSCCWSRRQKVTTTTTPNWKVRFTEKGKIIYLHLGLVTRLVRVPSVYQELLILSGLGASHWGNGCNLRWVADLKYFFCKFWVKLKLPKNCYTYKIM